MPSTSCKSLKFICFASDLQDKPIDPSQSLTAYTTLKINIQDGDDQPPAFEYSGCARYKGACVDAQYGISVRDGAAVS